MVLGLKEKQQCLCIRGNLKRTRRDTDLICDFMMQTVMAGADADKRKKLDKRFLTDGLKPYTVKALNIVTMDDVNLGEDVTIKQGKPGKLLLIEQDAVVGIGTVLAKSVSPGTTVVGNPVQQLAKN